MIMETRQVAWSKTADKIEGFREYLSPPCLEQRACSRHRFDPSTEKEKRRYFVWISDGVWGRWGRRPGKPWCGGVRGPAWK